MNIREKNDLTLDDVVTMLLMQAIFNASRSNTNAYEVAKLIIIPCARLEYRARRAGWILASDSKESQLIR